MSPLRTLVIVSVLALALAAPLASAHKTAYTPDGSVKVVWGFLNEPAVTMTKTGLDLILSDNATGAPLGGAEETLEASLVLGADVHEFALRPQHGQSGRYTDVLTLTKPGLYTLRLRGTLNGTAIEMDVPAAHEVTAIEETYFPEIEAGSTADLAQRVAQLQARVEVLEARAKAQSEAPSPTSEQTNEAPAFGALAALGAVGLALALRRRA